MGLCDHFQIFVGDKGIVLVYLCDARKAPNVQNPTQILS